MSAAAVGTLVGVWANGFVSRGLYGVILAALLAVVGGNVIYREFRDLEPRVELGRKGATSPRSG